MKPSVPVKSSVPLPHGTAGTTGGTQDIPLEGSIHHNGAREGSSYIMDTDREIMDMSANINNPPEFWV